MQGYNLTPIPKSQDAWNREFTELFQRTDRDSVNGRKELLLSMVATQRLKRPTKQGVIFVMGSSGVGKSSTINHLFNLRNDSFTELARTNSFQSETMEVREYLLQSTSERYEASDLVLGIVDTPGFQDTGGLKQEACNMFAIKQFIAQHPSLQGRYPNLILICFDATDVRFLGDSSNFGKFMKCLSKLKLVDQDHPNVVAVITKCCSLRPDYLRRPIEWKKNLDSLQANVRQIIEKYLFIEVPVVILENHPEEEILERPVTENNLPSDFTILPNGELQPYNLFKSCSNLLKRHNDLFGEICFNATFLESNRSELQRGFAVAAKDATIHHLNRGEEKLLVFLDNVYKYIRKNEIKRKAEEYFVFRKLNERQKQEIDAVVRDLNSSGIFNLHDIQYITLQGLLYHCNLNLTDVQINFASESLKVKAALQNYKLGDKLASGYNIFTDSFAKRNIFELNYCQHRFGLTVPENCELNPLKSVMNVGELSDNPKILVNKRLEYLNIRSKVNEENFEYNRRPGFYLLTPNSSLIGGDHFIYFESWQLKINFSLNNVRLTQEFKKSVKNLPDQFTQQTFTKFRDFLYEFGHFYISAAFAGGAYEKCTERTGCTGGHSQFRDTVLKNSKMKKLWLASIVSRPVILTTCMELKPISTIVALIDSNKANSVQIALSELFHFENVGGESDHHLSRFTTCDTSSSETNEDNDGRPKLVPLTREEAVDFEIKKLEKILSSLLGGILGILAIAFFPITIIVAFTYAKLG